MKGSTIIMLACFMVAVIICGLSFHTPAPVRILGSSENVDDVSALNSAACLPYDAYFVRVNSVGNLIASTELPTK
jgi:hypothetical protein